MCVCVEKKEPVQMKELIMQDNSWPDKKGPGKGFLNVGIPTLFRGPRYYSLWQNTLSISTILTLS